MTFEKLKTELDRLSPDQLKQDAVFWPNEGGPIVIYALAILEEDHYANGDGDFVPKESIPEDQVDEFVFSKPKGYSFFY